MTVRRSLAVFSAVLLAAFLLFGFVANFSSVESRFECPGAFSSERGNQKATAYLKLHEYRWWVGLWSDADAAIWVEVPNESIDYFGNIIRVGDQLQIRELQGKPQGHFSTLSKTLALKTSRGFFDSTCKPIAR